MNNLRIITITLMILQLFVSAVVCQSSIDDGNKQKDKRKVSKSSQNTQKNFVSDCIEDCANGCKGFKFSFFIEEEKQQPDVLYIIASPFYANPKTEFNYSWLVSDYSGNKKIESPILKVERGKIKEDDFEVKLLVKILSENKIICEIETLLEVNPKNLQIKVLEEKQKNCVREIKAK